MFTITFMIWSILQFTSADEGSVEFLPETLSQTVWEDTNGNTDITSLTGTVREITTDECTVNALCWDPSQRDLTFIDYDINPDVTPELTMEVAIYPETRDPTKFDRIMSNGDGGFDRAIVIFEPNSNIRWGGTAAHTGTDPYSSSISLAAQMEWTIITVTYSVENNQIIVYKNGGVITGGEQQSVAIGGDQISTLYTRVGLNGFENSPANNYFTGCIGSVRIDDHVLTALEIAERYETSPVTCSRSKRCSTSFRCSPPNSVPPVSPPNGNGPPFNPKSKGKGNGPKWAADIPSEETLVSDSSNGCDDDDELVEIIKKNGNEYMIYRETATAKKYIKKYFE